MTTDADSKLLYQSAEKIQPRQVWGRYSALRVLALLALLGFYYAAPWIAIGGEPLVLLDLPHRRFHVFGLTLVPQDLIYLTWLLLIAALTLFFFTTLGGRLWCGYACPQTVWTEAFLWMEQLVEGNRHARMKLDRAPWSANKLLRRGAKHMLWAVFALYTGVTFVAYFVPAREVFPAALSLDLGGWPLFWTLFYAIATWGNAGFLREQVCLYMCPYARFQSAMFDRDTLIISYDVARGEPRKGLARHGAVPLAALAPHSTADSQGERSIGSRPLAAKLIRGDCIDCTLCVQVCPTGIDIRNGLQYECIACAACIDACNGAMDAVGKPRGLIRYTSARQDAGGAFQLGRPRAIGYGLIWLALCAGFVAALVLRAPLDLDVIRDRHTLYRELPDGAIENLYTLKIANKDSHAHAFVLTAEFKGAGEVQVEPSRFELPAGERRAVAISVRRRGAERVPVAAGTFTLRAEDEPALAKSRTTTFLSGGSP